MSLQHTLASYSSTNLTATSGWFFNHKENSVLFLTGQVIPAGTVVGMVTNTGKVIPSIADASDGSQIPIGITYFDIDTSSTGTNSDYAFSVIVEAEMVDFGGLATLTSASSGTGAQKWTATTLKNALRTQGIHIRTYATV